MSTTTSPTTPRHESTTPRTTPRTSIFQSPSVPPLLLPNNFTNKHVSYILLAEFDILKGSQLKYQYPIPTNIKER